MAQALEAINIMIGYYTARFCVPSRLPRTRIIMLVLFNTVSNTVVIVLYCTVLCVVLLITVHCNCNTSPAALQHSYDEYSAYSFFVADIRL